MSYQLRHIGIVTNKIEESIKFYKNFFNFSIISDELEKGTFIENILSMKNIEVRTVKMTNQEFTLEFLDFKEKNINSKIDLKTIGCTHIAITVKDIKEVYNKLLNNNIEFLSKPLLSNNKKALVCFLKDPNNNFFLELVENKAL